MLSQQTTRAINLDAMHGKLFWINAVIYTCALAILPCCLFFGMTPKLLICKLARRGEWAWHPTLTFLVSEKFVYNYKMLDS